MKRIVRFIKNTLKWIVVAFFASTILSVVMYRFLPVWVTPLMVIRCYEQLKEGKDLKLSHDWVPLSEISPSLPVAVIASEDGKFIEHHGFDYKAIEHAAKRNREHPEKRKLGASTISQQTAKNVFLWPGRSWVRKGFEVYFTTLIELLWSKQRIMEVYLASMGRRLLPRSISTRMPKTLLAASVPSLPPRCPIPESSPASLLPPICSSARHAS